MQLLTTEKCEDKVVLVHEYRTVKACEGSGVKLLTLDADYFYVSLSDWFTSRDNGTEDWGNTHSRSGCGVEERNSAFSVN
jgi:hypothetical protein